MIGGSAYRDVLLCKMWASNCRPVESWRNPVGYIKKVSESSIESRFCKRVQMDGYQAIKLGGDGKRGKADRIILMNKNIHFFIEFKAPGKELRKIQQYRAKQLRDLNHAVYEIDSYEEAIKIYERYKVYATRLPNKGHRVLR